jgi:hypothetical protein
MENNNAPSPAVTTIIESLPKASDAKGPRRQKRKYTRRQRRGADSSTRRSPGSSQSASSEENENGLNSATFLKIISNLALLLAVFTIVFAAHRAIQGNKKEAALTAEPVQVTQPAPQPPKIEKKAEPAQVAEVPKAEEKQPEGQKIEDQKVAEPEEKETVAEEQKAETEKPETKAEEPKTEATTAVRDMSDPYTNGGPLDLDRPENAALLHKAVPSAKTQFSDVRNPWNSGGVMDLDAEAARQEYKKRYLSSTESDIQK